MDYKEINNIYKELIKIIEKENNWSEVWIGLIIILPSLIKDIYCINLTNFYLIDEIDFILERLSYGFKKNFFVELIKETIKKAIYKIKLKNYFSPNLSINKNIKNLVFDSALNNVISTEWNNKEIENFHFSSVISYFPSKLKIKESDHNKEIYNISFKIIKVIVQNIEVKNRRKWNKKFQSEFRLKLYNSMIFSILRFKYCDKKLPKRLENVYIPTLHSPFNRIVALTMQKKGGGVITFDHGSGVGNTKNWIPADIEFQIANQFITFGKDYLPILEKYNLKRKYLLDIDFKIIPSNTKYKKNKRKKNFLNIKNIIYLTTITSTPQEHTIPDTLEITSYTILKINILKSLSKLKNFDKFIKEHPETKESNLISNDILKSLNIEKTKKDLDNLCNDENLFIIDYVQTSCLRFVLENKLRTILIIHNKSDISDAFSEALEKYNFLKTIYIKSFDKEIDSEVIEKSVNILNKIKKENSGKIFL